MSSYHPAMVVAKDGTVISLKAIESVNFARTSEDETADKLKDDCVIVIITLSGQRYELSMKDQIKTFGSYYSLSKDVIELRQTIFERWINLIS